MTWTRASRHCALLALAGVVLASPVPAQQQAERIVVVGAGFSGLTAARLLHDSGFDVVVLEAKDRIGGRAWTLDLAGAPVDMGAMFLHGTEGHPGATLAESHGVELRRRAQDLGLAFDGVARKELSADERMSLLIVGSVFMAQAGTLRQTMAPDISSGAAIDRFLDQRAAGGRARRYERFGLEQILLEVFDSGPPREIAFAHTQVYQELEGGDHLPVGGYVRLVNLLAEGLDIRLETRVEKIEYGSAGVRLTTSQGLFEGDKVLITVSQGVLESGAITFEPPLPEERRSAIERLDMGNLEKVIFVFEEAFWRLARSESRSFLYIGENPGELPACLDFTDYVGKPSLTCLYGGQSARDLLATRTKAEIEARAVEILAEVFGPGVPRPLGVASSRWLEDDEVRGSYSYLPVGSSPRDMIELGQPVGERLFFAGEATVPEYYGTVHGAMLSGIREAARLGATRGEALGLCAYLPVCH